MNINNHIYIYKSLNDEMLLEDYVKLLKANEKEKLIKIFKKKYIEDFIESSDILIRYKKLYSVSTILVSAIDVLAKHYTGSINKNNIGNNYEEFLKKYFDELKTIFDLKKEFYGQFRCSIVHSNSSVIDFTIDEEIKTFEEQGGRKVINLNWLKEKVSGVLNEYMEEVKTNEDLYNKFLNTEKSLYCDLEK